MLEGKYIIDSIENRLVKLLFSGDETIEEVVSKDQFLHPIKQGDVIKVKFVDGKLISIPLESETEKRREEKKNFIGKLIKENK